MPLQPDMMIAMPPKARRPVIVQTQPNLPGLTFDTDFILQLVRLYPNLGYVKEGAEPVFERRRIP